MKPWVVKSYDVYRRNKYLLIFLPALLVVTVFFFVPIITLFRISFYEYTGMGVFEPAFNLSGYIKFLTDPFYVKIILYTVKNAVLVTFISLLAGYDFSVEDAARDLGAGPIKTFFLITLPRIRTGVFTAMIFSFITSFGEFNIAVFLTATDTMTMPVQIWGSLRYEVTPIVAAVSTVMICTTLIGIAIGSRFIGIQKISEM